MLFIPLLNLFTMDDSGTKMIRSTHGTVLVRATAYIAPPAVAKNKGASCRRHALSQRELLRPLPRYKNISHTTTCIQLFIAPYTFL